MILPRVLDRPICYTSVLPLTYNFSAYYPLILIEDMMRYLKIVVREFGYGSVDKVLVTQE